MELRPARRDQIAELVDFCEHFPLAPSWSLPAARLLSDLPSCDACILDVWDQGERQAVAVVIDTVRNLDNVALLEVMGRLPTAGSTFLSLMQPVAERLVREAGRWGLECYLPEHLGWSTAFQEAGWGFARDAFMMERADSEIPGPTLPTGLRWRDLEPADVLSYYHLVQEAFAEDPGVQLADYPSFLRALESRDLPIRLLCRYEKLLGFVRVSIENGVGNLDSLGRAPAWRGKGLGPLVVAEGARILNAHGATRLRLGVTGNNVAARTLYRNLGFVDLERSEVWLRWLPEAG